MNERDVIATLGSGESAKSSLGHTSPALIQGNDMEGEPRAAVLDAHVEDLGVHAAVRVE